MVRQKKELYMARKTLAQEHTELAERFAALTTEADKFKGELAAAITARDEAVSRAAALANENKTMGEQIAGHLNTVAELTTARDTFKAQAEKSQAEADAAKAQLALTPIPNTEGAAPVADGGQAPASAVQSMVEQFAAIKDPAKRTAFFRAHKKEILKETTR